MNNILFTLSISNSKLLLLLIGMLVIFSCQIPRNTASNNGKFIEQNQIQSLEELIKKKRLKIEDCMGTKSVSFQDLPCDCHVQGLGWAVESQQIVLTCQDKCEQKNGAYLLLFDENGMQPNDVQRSTLSAVFNHPSAIQISQEIFPVAFAGARYEDSFIDFYTLKNKQINQIKDSRIHVKNRHIGALAYATINSVSYLVGVGWDAENLMIWKANGKNSATDFAFHFYTDDATSIIKRPFRNKWGAYNSLWLGQLSDNRVILIGTHGGSKERKSYLDMWEVFNISAGTPTLKLLSSKKINATTLAGENFFYEGVTIKTVDNNLTAVSIIAAPHDFKKDKCPDGFRCSENIYEILAH